MTQSDDDYWKEVDKAAPQSTVAPAPVVVQPQSQDDADYWANVDKSAPKSTVAPVQAQTTGRGLTRNAAAGTIDAGANAANIAADPVSNLIYYPLWSLGTGAYNLLARNVPSLGLHELSNADLDALYRDDYRNQRPGQVIEQATGADKVQAASPAEALIRKGVAATETGALLSPSAVAGGAIAGTSAVGGDLASRAVPTPYKDAVETATNILSNAAGARVAGNRSSSMSEPEANIVQLGRQYGIDVPAPVGTVGQVSQNTPLSGYPAYAGRVQSQWRQQVSRLMGEDTDRITQQTINAADARTGAVMDHVEQQPVNLDSTFQGQLAQIEADAHAEFGPNTPQFQRVQNLLNSTMANVQQNGTIPGGTFASLIHKGAPIDNAIAGRNSDISSYGVRLKDALQDALQRSVSPDDAAAYQQARQQYAATRMIEPLTQRTGRATTAGEIDPDQFLVAARNNAPANSPAMDLARIGQMLPKTADDRTAVREGYGALEMAKAAGGTATATALLPGLLANRLLASPYLRSNFRTNVLLNNVLNPGPRVSPYLSLPTNPLLMSQ